MEDGSQLLGGFIQSYVMNGGPQIQNIAPAPHGGWKHWKYLFVEMNRKGRRLGYRASAMDAGKDHGAAAPEPFKRIEANSSDLRLRPC